MNKIKVGLIVEEFFSPDMGGYGGYGMLARNYIARYIPNDEIEIEVFIGRTKSFFKGEEKIVDGIKVNKIPKKFKKNYFKKKQIDVYLSVETNRMFYEILSIEKEKPIILYGQDPRPYEDWEKIQTVPNQSEYDAYLNYYSLWEDKIRKTVHLHLKNKTLNLISQGNYLMGKMKKLYELPIDIKIDYVPNPMEFNNNPTKEIEDEKEYITFLGRLDSVKRPWLFFELAKKFPNETFIVCGKNQNPEVMDEVLEKYKGIKNLVFKGHVTGIEKDQILRKTKILVNTSIHEAIPISFLEAISYGCRLLSCQNPDNLTSDNGRYTGVINGDGMEKIASIETLLKELLLEKISLEEKLKIFEFYKELYSVEKFKEVLRKKIKEVKNRGEK